MESETQVLLLGVVFPLILSIITAILFARILAPLFLKAKENLLARKYTDGYISRSPSPFRKKILAKRLIYLILLTFGLVSSLIMALDLEQWLSPETLCSYEERGLDPRYHFTLFLTVQGLIYPIAVGLWAVSWAIEDSGLMHYVFRSDDYYEIEPIHVRYTSYLKGYAGFSAILFVIQFTSYQGQNNSPEDAALILAVLLIAIVCFFPTYFIFTKVMGSHSYLRKNLNELKKLTENDLT